MVKQGQGCQRYPKAIAPENAIGNVICKILYDQVYCTAQCNDGRELTHNVTFIYLHLHCIDYNITVYMLESIT